MAPRRDETWTVVQSKVQRKNPPKSKKPEGRSEAEGSYQSHNQGLWHMTRFCLIGIKKFCLTIPPPPAMIGLKSTN